MTKKCTICGESIPRSIAEWCLDKTGTIDEIWKKAFIFANFLKELEIRYTDYHAHYENDERYLRTQLYLWHSDDGNHQFPICWSCAIDGYRKCITCGNIYTASIDDGDDRNYYLVHNRHHYINVNCYNYNIDGAESWDYCADDNCQLSRRYMGLKFNHPGRNKLTREIRVMIDNCEMELASAAIATGLIDYHKYTNKKTRNRRSRTRR